RRRRRGQRGGAARARVGRQRRPVQQHRLGDDGPAAAQARRPTADRNRGWQGVPDVSRPRPSVRARLTLLYTGLFAVCGAIVVAVSYAQVAQMGAQGQGQGSAGAPASFAARCRSESTLAHPDAAILAKCTSYLELQGAQAQRDFTLSHLLQYSLIT